MQLHGPARSVDLYALKKGIKHLEGGHVGRCWRLILEAINGAWQTISPSTSLLGLQFETMFTSVDMILVTFWFSLRHETWSFLLLRGLDGQRARLEATIFLLSSSAAD